MTFDSINLIYFSPTGTTRSIVTGMARGIGIKTVIDRNLTLQLQSIDTVQGDLAIIGAPVYGGRVPAVAAERLQSVHGRATPSVAVVVYGNRAYEDALLELKDLVEANGFTVIAAGAFIGEHSYATASHPIAKGRPDRADLELAESFGRQIAAKIADKDRLALSRPLSLPGSRPYKERSRPLGESPITLTDLCTLCGTCAAVCPTRVITVDEHSVATDQSRCIACCACIKNCPSQARMYMATTIAARRQFLFENHGDCKSPEMFI